MKVRNKRWQKSNDHYRRYYNHDFPWRVGDRREAIPPAKGRPVIVVDCDYALADGDLLQRGERFPVEHFLLRGGRLWVMVHYRLKPIDTHLMLPPYCWSLLAGNDYTDVETKTYQPNGHLR